MQKTNIAIIGLGGIAQIIHLPFLTSLKEADIVSICDKDFSKARALAKKYGINSFYKDAGEMLSKEKSIDAVIIAAATDVHKELAVASLKAGKHTFVERPLARNYTEAKPIVEAVKKSGKKLMVGMNNRYRQDVMMARNFLREREIGEVFYVKAGWLKARSSDRKWFTEKDKSGGGVLLDNGIAMLDIGMWMLGFPEIDTINAINYYHNTKSVEDTNLTLVKFKNGSTLRIEVSWSLNTEDFYYCDVFGSSGSASINPLKIYKRVTDNLLDITPKNIKMPANLFKSSYEVELKSFIGAVQGKNKVLSNGEDALKIMEIIETIYASAKKKKEIIYK